MSNRFVPSISVMGIPEARPRPATFSESRNTASPPCRQKSFPGGEAQNWLTTPATGTSVSFLSAITAFPAMLRPPQRVCDSPVHTFLSMLFLQRVELAVQHGKLLRHRKPQHGLAPLPIRRRQAGRLDPDKTDLPPGREKRREQGKRCAEDLLFTRHRQRNTRLLLDRHKVSEAHLHRHRRRLLATLPERLATPLDERVQHRRDGPGVRSVPRKRRVARDRLLNAVQMQDGRMPAFDDRRQVPAD